MFKHGFTIVSSQVSCSFFFTGRLYTVYCILNTKYTFCMTLCPPDARVVAKTAYALMGKVTVPVLAVLLQEKRVCQNVHILFFMHKAPTFSSQGFAIS